MREEVKVASFKFPKTFLKLLKDYCEKNDVSQRKALQEAFTQYLKQPQNEKTSQLTYVVCKYSVPKGCWRSDDCKSCNHIPEEGFLKNDVCFTCDNCNWEERTIAKQTTNFVMEEGEFDCCGGTTGFIIIDDIKIDYDDISYLFVDYGELQETIVCHNE